MNHLNLLPFEFQQRLRSGDLSQIEVLAHTWTSGIVLILPRNITEYQIYKQAEIALRTSLTGMWLEQGTFHTIQDYRKTKLTFFFSFPRRSRPARNTIYSWIHDSQQLLCSSVLVLAPHQAQ